MLSEKEKAAKAFRNDIFNLLLIIRILTNSLRLLISAKLYVRSRIDRLKLTPVTTKYSTDKATKAKIIKGIDSLLAMPVLGSRRRCFYRSYVLFHILRNMGLNVSLNIGMRHMGGNQYSRGHCWLSENDRTILEMFDPLEVYPHKLNKTDRDINFYMGLKEDVNLRRHKSSFILQEDRYSNLFQPKFGQEVKA